MHEELCAPSLFGIVEEATLSFRDLAPAFGLLEHGKPAFHALLQCALALLRRLHRLRLLSASRLSASVEEKGCEKHCVPDSQLNAMIWQKLQTQPWEGVPWAWVRKAFYCARLCMRYSCCSSVLRLFIALLLLFLSLPTNTAPLR